MMAGGRDDTTRRCLLRPPATGRPRLGCVSHQSLFAWVAIVVESAANSTVACVAGVVAGGRLTAARTIDGALTTRGVPFLEKMMVEPAILWENEAVVAVDTPAGWLTIPDRSDGTAVPLQVWAEEALGARLFEVDGLDRDASGVVLFAKSADAQRALHQQCERRTVDEQYLALVRGGPKPHGFIRFGLDEDPEHPGRLRVAHPGTPALTHFRVLERFHGFSWLALEPQTGRTHQVRVHCAALGHALAVDACYGARTQLTLADLGVTGDGNMVLIDRLTLHRARIGWNDPTTAQPVSVEAPLPDDLQRTLDALRRHAPRAG